MTEVLSITRPDASVHFGSPLRRSSSQASFLLQSPPSPPRSSSNPKSRYTAVGYDARRPASVPSSAPSSPRLTAPEFSNQPLYTSTPSSSLSLDEQCTANVEDIVFPSYDDRNYYDEAEDPEPPASPELSVHDVRIKSISNESLIARTFPEAFEAQPAAGDDTAISREPTRHVDYLSHNWKEEDIWSSWRHIVAKRKAYSNSPRLENASWRTWAKSKYKLKTVSPETLNWMKDHDVTWLYGPLQTETAWPFDLNSTPPRTKLSRSRSFALKKPILKKRSLSEIMLQRSISSSTLMKQATDALRAQQPGKGLHDGPVLSSRALSDLVNSPETGTPLTRTTTITMSTEPSASTSGRATPCTKRHIHFNNKVEQCIAINKETYDRHGQSSAVNDDNDSSDDDILVMKPVKNATKAKINSNQSAPRNSFSGESKTIAMLPSTTLNYRGDTPEPVEQRVRQKELWGGKLPLSPSSSQQPLQPSVSSSSFMLDDEDEEIDLNWQPSASFFINKDGIYAYHDTHMNAADDSNSAEHVSLRRTPSGMFMPYEDDEDDTTSDGLLGKVVDTVNTAKDIAHVIWNVGWRR